MTEQNDVEKVKELEGQVADLQAELSNVRQEAARSRVARNNERKKVFALEQVISAHNVKFSLDEQDLSSLSISQNDGSVEGEFQYEPPEIKPDIPKASGKAESLTLDDLNSMDEDEMNSRWDEIVALGKTGVLT